MKRVACILMASAALAACGEKPQTVGTPKSDSAPYAGTGSGFVVSGWKAGDKTSWEQHLKARQLNSQNDYSRMN